MGKIVIESRIDIVDLANLAHFLHSKNILPATKSEIIRLAVGTFIDIVITDRAVTTTSGALKLLNQYGINIGDKGIRSEANRKSLSGELRLESLLKEGAELDDILERNASMDSSSTTLPPEVAKRALKQFITERKENDA